MNFYTNVYLHKKHILLRGWRDGKRIEKKIVCRPYLFLPTPKDAPPTRYRTLAGQPVARMSFDDVWEARKFIKDYEDVENFKMYGMSNWVYPFIFDTYKGEIEYDPNRINVGTVDIEVTMKGQLPNAETGNNMITAITLRSRGKSKIFSYKSFVQLEGIEYVHCRDEKELLLKFLEAWIEADLDVITGWNIEFFDIPYLVNRIARILGTEAAEKLSPWGMLYEREVQNKWGVQKVFDIVGISILDYQGLYKKFSFKGQESYALDNIANVELDEAKVSYKGTLDELYENDFQTFIVYNNHDCVLVDKLEAKLNFIQQVFALAYDAKVNYNDTLTTVRPWEVICHNHLLAKGIVMPMKEHKPFRDFGGGYVKEPIPNKYKWVASVDLTSLYPHLLIQYNISPETLVGKLPFSLSVEQLLAGELYSLHSEYNELSEYSIAANMCMYRKDKRGFIPELMEEKFRQRNEAKKKMLDAKKRYEATKDESLKAEIAKWNNMQMAKKIQLNSLYGALGNQYFAFFEIDNAEAVTLSGQLSVQWAAKAINAFMNDFFKTKEQDYIIYIDTDSCYIHLEKLVERVVGSKEVDINKIVDMLDKFIETKIQPVIQKAYAELATYMNAYQNVMDMKRETIADGAIWLKKKRYILRALDIEGVRLKEPEIKMTGIEAVRSSTPKVVRKAIKDCIKVVLSGNVQDVRDFVDSFRAEFETLELEDIAKPSGINGLTEYFDASNIYKKGTPMHVRGALLHNYHIKRLGLHNKYEMIREGEKIKCMYLKMPNTIHENVISFKTSLPPELNLEKYVDRDIQFDKVFVSPIRKILEAIGWQLEARANLDDFIDAFLAEEDFEDEESDDDSVCEWGCDES